MVSDIFAKLRLNLNVINYFIIYLSYIFLFKISTLLFNLVNCLIYIFITIFYDILVFTCCCYLKNK